MPTFKASSSLLQSYNEFKFLYAYMSLLHVEELFSLS